MSLSSTGCTQLTMHLQHYTQTKANEEIYKSLGRCLRTAASRSAGDYRHLANEQTMQLEIAPYINRIISPPLRPVNSQVIRPAEKALLSRLVNIMATLELRFVQERQEDGQLVYRLDPPIDVFVTYDGKRSADIAVSRYAVRHLVAAEVSGPLIACSTDTEADGSRRSMPRSSLARRRARKRTRRASLPSSVAGEYLSSDVPCGCVVCRRAAC